MRCLLLTGLLLVARLGQGHAAGSACADVACGAGEECRLRHVCSETDIQAYLPPCHDEPQCVPAATCVGHACPRGHHCRLEPDPSPEAAEFRPPLQRPGCELTTSCDQLSCPPGQACITQPGCEHSLDGYLPPCRSLYVCGAAAGPGEGAAPPATALPAVEAAPKVDVSQATLAAVGGVQTGSAAASVTASVGSVNEVSSAVGKTSSTQEVSRPTAQSCSDITCAAGERCEMKDYKPICRPVNLC
ncbi:uncharacterized protein LOC119112439 [Pollicipes pollicipes]|uniref:uncharacterized protein LOC119112439 n=1 Tax=Pollicipes pollicipes TaxID=41117 RepID=UPI001884E215|nr:uncharacterized protein LOC119112439 [Pollicipes pollicipes]